MTETMLVAGPELNALIAEEVMGEVLTVPYELALAMVGVLYVRSAGNPFSIDVPGRGPTMLVIPDLEDIPGHPSDYNPNARYFRYVAQHLLSLGGEIATRVECEIAACRLTPKPYSTDIAAAWTVVERMHADGWWIDVEAEEIGYLVVMEPFDPEGLRRTEQRAEIAPLAICRAALAAVEAA